MKNKFYNLLFHVHTNHSADGLISPKLLLNYCNKNDIDILIVTDHDSISSFEQLKKINSGNSIKLIPGIEFSTNLGDVIGIFIDKEINKRVRAFFNQLYPWIICGSWVIINPN